MDLSQTKLTKNIKNEISAFHNVCSHRCVKLVDEKKKCWKINKLSLPCLVIRFEW